MKILYICTHNRCRSILSEAITNHIAQGQLHAFSAGSQPAGAVHPLSLRYLAAANIDCTGLRSQSWDDYQQQPMDVVVTVCDRAAAETCPLWLGDQVRVHWGLPDPSQRQGTEAQVRAAFYAVMGTIEQRVQQLLCLQLDKLGHSERQVALETLTVAQTHG